MFGSCRSCIQVGIFCFFYYTYVELWAALFLSPLVFSCVSAVSFNSANPKMATIVHSACSNHPSFFWLSAIGLIFSFPDQILGLCWLSQNRLGRFCWTSYILTCFMACLLLKRFVLCCWIYVVGQYSGFLKTGCVLLHPLLEE